MRRPTHPIACRPQVELRALTRLPLHYASHSSVSRPHPHSLTHRPHRLSLTLSNAAPLYQHSRASLKPSHLSNTTQSCIATALLDLHRWCDPSVSCQSVKALETMSAEGSQLPIMHLLAFVPFVLATAGQGVVPVQVSPSVTVPPFPPCPCGYTQGVSSMTVGCPFFYTATSLFMTALSSSNRLIGPQRSNDPHTLRFTKGDTTQLTNHSHPPPSTFFSVSVDRSVRPSSWLCRVTERVKCRYHDTSPHPHSASLSVRVRTGICDSHSVFAVSSAFTIQCHSDCTVPHTGSGGRISHATSDLHRIDRSRATQSMRPLPRGNTSHHSHVTSLTHSVSLSPLCGGV